MQTHPLRACLCLLSILVFPALTSAQGVDDRYIAGYASAVLEREFRIPDATLVVQNGRMTVYVEDLSGEDINKVKTALGRIRGVRDGAVEIIVARPPQEVQQLPEAMTDTRARATGSPDAPVAPDASVVPDRSVAPGATDASGSGVTSSPPVAPPFDLSGDSPALRQTVKGDDWALLPRTKLFSPLLADPRWPHFSAAWDFYQQSGDVELENVGSISVGESFTFYRSDFPGGAGRWELGIQAAVFAIFDLDGESKDLINADYFVGPTLAYRWRDFSLMARIYHQSSHLGDEFIFSQDVTEAQRVNFSYEVVDILLSYDLTNHARIYGGGGYILNVEPSDYDKGLLQYGFELTSPWGFYNGAVTPVLMADFQHSDENGWDVDISARTGFRITNPRSASQRTYILFEYYNGRSPNGQFFDQKIEFYGVGLHVYF